MEKKLFPRFFVNKLFKKMLRNYLGIKKIIKKYLLLEFFVNYLF
jgi:hypothetical protein